MSSRREAPRACDNLTPYDAAYVALAEMLETMLLTADEGLARAPRLECDAELLRRSEGAAPG